MSRRVVIILLSLMGFLLTTTIIVVAYLATRPQKISGVLPETKKAEILTEFSLGIPKIRQNEIISFNKEKELLEKIISPEQRVPLASLSKKSNLIWDAKGEKAVVFTCNESRLNNSPFYTINAKEGETTAWLYYPSTGKKIQLPSGTYTASFSPKGQLAIATTTGSLSDSTLYLISDYKTIQPIKNFNYLIKFSWLDEQNLAFSVAASEISGQALRLFNINTGTITEIIAEAMVGDFLPLPPLKKVIFHKFDMKELKFTLAIFDINSRTVKDSGKQISFSELAVNPAQTKVVAALKQNETYGFFEIDLETADLMPLNYDRSVEIKDLIDISFYPDGRNLLINTSTKTYRLTVF